MPHPHEHLYDVSIDVLNLSEYAKQNLLSTHIESIGDLADYYHRPLGGGTLYAKRWIMDLMNGEVKEKMRAAGYGDYLYEDDTY